MWTGKHKVVYICSAQRHVSSRKEFGRGALNKLNRAVSYLSAFPTGMQWGTFLLSRSWADLVHFLI